MVTYKRFQLNKALIGNILMFWVVVPLMGGVCRHMKVDMHTYQMVKGELAWSNTDGMNFHLLK